MTSDGHQPERYPTTTLKVGTFADCPNVIISITGYTRRGELSSTSSLSMQTRFGTLSLRLASPRVLCQLVLVARDTLRLEAGFCLYGETISTISTRR